MSADAWRWVLAAATPLLAFAGSLVGHWWTRRASKELDRWRRREESMRLLRWAVELAVSEEDSKSLAGVVVLDSLLDSPLLDDDDVELVANVAGFIAVGA